MLTPILCSIRLFSRACSIYTSLGWYADRVPCTCSCLLPDTCRSRVASEDSGAVIALHLNNCKKSWKKFESGSVLARWQSREDFVVHHGATDSSESRNRGVGFPHKGKKNMHARTCNVTWDSWRILNKRLYQVCGCKIVYSKNEWRVQLILSGVWGLFLPQWFLHW